jgi:hypothetical protein
MPAIEEELREAISYRNEMAVELASNLLFLASEDGIHSERGDEPWGIAQNRGIINGRYQKVATDIEALTAVILQRAGVPWDALAAPAGISKQALHRRLGSRGDALFAKSLRQSDERETDPRALIRSLRKAQHADDWEELDAARLSLPMRSGDLIGELVGLPRSEDILTAPTQFAATLAELRKIPLWWHSRE